MGSGLSTVISAADFAGLFGPPPGWLVIAADGTVSRTLPAEYALLPGSFNPVHEGHWQLAKIAERILARSVLFELSVHNVDKPALTRGAVQRRLATFQGKAPVVLTCAPLFTEKARFFRGCVFVIGADTAARLVDLRYYGGDVIKLMEAFTTLRGSGCRFLVAARKDNEGRLVTLENINIPTAIRDLFTSISPDEFQFDVSSTQLRGPGSDAPKEVPKPLHDAFASRLRESVRNRRPWTFGIVAVLIAFLLFSCAGLVFFFQPGGASGPAGAVVFDVLVSKGEDAELAAQLFSPDIDHPTQLRGRELYFELQTEPAPPRSVVRSDGAGAARTTWKPADKVSEYRLHWLDNRLADQARVFALPQAASLVVVDVQTLTSADGSAWKKENILDIPAIADAGRVLSEIAAKDREIVYLALGPDEVFGYRKVRGWMELRFADCPMGPVLGRTSYDKKSNSADELLKVLASLRKRFSGSMVFVTGTSELAKAAWQAEVKTLILSDEAPAGCIAVRDWAGLAEHFAKKD